MAKTQPNLTTRPDNEPYPDNPYSNIYGRHLTDREVKIANDAQREAFTPKPLVFPPIKGGAYNG